MQVDSKKLEPGFRPVELSITFENQREMAAFHAIFNHPIICDLCRNHGLEPIQIRDHIITDDTEPYDELNAAILRFGWK